MAGEIFRLFSDGSCAFSTPTGGTLFDENCDGLAEVRKYAKNGVTVTKTPEVTCSADTRIDPLDFINPCSFYSTFDRKDQLLSKLRDVMKIITEADPREIAGMFKFERLGHGAYAIDLTYKEMGGFSTSTKLYLTETDKGHPGPDQITIIESWGSGKTFIYEHLATIDTHASILTALFELCRVKLAHAKSDNPEG